MLAWMDIIRDLVTEAARGVLTFLIADVRGYMSFTRQRGDEAAARLAAKFAEIAREGVEWHGGTVTELRGDEALAVFTSPRAALRAAVDLQMAFGGKRRLRTTKLFSRSRDATHLFEGRSRFRISSYCGPSPHTQGSDHANSVLIILSNCSRFTRKQCSSRCLSIDWI
jgi:class 3 adenylate cyclase